jgi:hypothetical protein
MVDDWDQIRTLLKQIQPGGRGAIRSWLREGLAFGEELSHDVRQVISKHSPEAVRMTERLEPLIRIGEDRDAVHTMLNGMDLELERLSELNERR